MRLLVVWAFLFRYYALDSVKTEKDIEEINEMVRLNKHEKIEFMPLKKRLEGFAGDHYSHDSV